MRLEVRTHHIAHCARGCKTVSECLALSYQICCSQPTRRESFFVSLLTFSLRDIVQRSFCAKRHSARRMCHASLRGLYRTSLQYLSMMLL